MAEAAIAPADSPAASSAPASAPIPTTDTAKPVATTNGTAPSTTPNAPAPDANAKEEWDGEIESIKTLGEDPVERGKAMRRYLTKKTQEIADVKSKAEQFEKFKADPSFAQFQQWKQSQNQPAPIQNQPAAPPAPIWSEGEWNEALINPSKMAELVQRGISAGVTQQINQYAPLIQEIQQRQAEANQKLTLAEKSQEIQDFAQIHPDVWDLYDAGILRPLVKDIVDSGNGTIADAYELAKKQETYYKQKAFQEAQGRVLEKKGAVTAAPSVANEPSVIWAEDREDAKRLAFENAVLGKKVTVKVKR